MGRGFVLILLFLLQLGVPGSEVVIVAISVLIPKLKIELLASALDALKKLEHLEARQRALAQRCADCAKEFLLDDVRLEIKACQSEIRRLRRSELDEALKAEMLRIDRAALKRFEAQRVSLESYAAAELQHDYLQFLADEVQEARRHFFRLARAYRENFPVRNFLPSAAPSALCCTCQTRVSVTIV